MRLPDACRYQEKFPWPLPTSGRCCYSTARRVSSLGYYSYCQVAAIQQPGNTHDISGTVVYARRLLLRLSGTAGPLRERGSACTGEQRPQPLMLNSEPALKLEGSFYEILTTTRFTRSGRHD
jgi:hypothetical protein